MESLIFGLAASALAGSVTASLRRNTRLKRRLRQGGMLLPDVVMSPLFENYEIIRVLAVHIRDVKLGAALDGEHLYFRVKYGSAGESVSCDTGSFHPERPQRAAARLVRHKPSAGGTELGTTCLFTLNETGTPLIRLRLRGAGRGRSVGGGDVAKGSLRPDVSRGMAEERVPLMTAGLQKDLIGSASVAVQIFSAPVSDLARCLELARAEVSDEGFVMSGANTTMVLGEVVGESDRGAAGDCQVGLPCPQRRSATEADAMADGQAMPR